MRKPRLALASVLAWCLAGAAWADDWQLLAVQAAGCPASAAWRAEALPRWAGSAPARAARLRVLDMDGPWPDGLALGPRPRATPAFILTHDGAEVGRVEGYAGRPAFDAALRRLLAAAGR